MYIHICIYIFVYISHVRSQKVEAHLPYSLSPPRPDRDQKDEYCMTCDFAVSTGTFQRAAQSSQILKLLIDTAADGLSQQFLKGHEEVSKDYKAR